MEVDIRQPPTARREAPAEEASWQDRRVAVRVVERKKYTTDTYVLRGPRPKGAIYSSPHIDESSCSLQGTWGNDTLRPVTIKQVLDAQQPFPEAEFKIDDYEIAQV